MVNREYDLDSLSDGIARMPRRLTARERLADHLFFFLQISSWFAVIAGAVLGYATYGVVGCMMWIIGGFLFGIWMRRSMGLRGPDPFHGYFRRIKERANGSHRGLLEWMIETLRGSGFTVSKCKAITTAYEQAMMEYHSARSLVQQKAILKRLDTVVKHISYSS